MIEAVVLDIGNVLIEWQPERFYDAAIGVDRRKALFETIDLHAMNDRVDRGEDFYTRVSECAVAHPDWHAEIMMWHDNWLDMASPAIPHSVRLLHALRSSGMPVFALSNFGIQTFEIAEPVYPFLKDFDRRYVSGYMGQVKPEPHIYQMLEDDSGVRPGALLFADDRQDNIDAAATRGWQTHLFDGPTGFADRLVSLGLLTSEDAK